MNRTGLLATGMVCGTTLLLGGMFKLAGAGDLAPPVGAVGPTMVTLDELNSKICAIAAATDDVADAGARESLFVQTLSEGASINLGGTGTAILRSAIVSRGRINIRDASNTELGALYAQATRTPGNVVRYDSSYQANYDILVDLPLTVTIPSGAGQSATFQLIISRISN